jgi:hypothetical protein
MLDKSTYIFKRGDNRKSTGLPGGFLVYAKNETDFGLAHNIKFGIKFGVEICCISFFITEWMEMIKDDDDFSNDCPSMVYLIFKEQFLPSGWITCPKCIDLKHNISDNLNHEISSTKEDWSADSSKLLEIRKFFPIMKSLYKQQIIDLYAGKQIINTDEMLEFFKLLRELR